MPIYEFTCGECGTTFEKILLDGKTENLVCPRCSSENIEKIFSVSSVHTGGIKSNPSCGNAQPCCGRDIPCSTRPCDK